MPLPSITLPILPNKAKGVQQQTGCPTPTPTASPRQRHDRTITLKLKHRGDGLVASGAVGVSDGFNACKQSVPVKLLRKQGGRFREIASTATNGRGRYSMKTGDKSAQYKAVAPRVEKAFGICLPADASKRHKH